MITELAPSATGRDGRRNRRGLYHRQPGPALPGGNPRGEELSGGQGGESRPGIDHIRSFEDDVTISSGATILGRVTIGRGSVIGGNVWLVHSVPPGSRITQAQSSEQDFERGAGI